MFTGSFKIRFAAGSALVSILFFGGACFADSSAAMREVRSVRYWTAPDHTRVVLDMSGESPYRIRVLTDPHRIAIDIPSGKFSGRVEPMDVNDGVLERIRINRLRSSAQVVLDLAGKVPFRHFALKPIKDRPHRIVVDLERVFSRDEIRRTKERTRRIAESGDYIVIIDPGHGGSDPGACIRSGPKEKDVVLALAKMLASEIDKHQGVRAVLTRDGDYYVGLQRRIDIARNHKGHCFLSLHMNSCPSSRPRGSEVYFLSLEGASDENAQAVAERENLFLEMGEEGEVITDDLKSILFDLNRSNSIYQSSLLADEIASVMRRDANLPFRGIKQANFVVLRSIAMPSVLVEVAFLSNKKDVYQLKRKGILSGLARSLAVGVVCFLKEHPPVEERAGKGEVAIHVVSKGETLWGIARKYGVTVMHLRAINSLGETSKIRPGQKLLLYK